MIEIAGVQPHAADRARPSELKSLAHQGTPDTLPNGSGDQPDKCEFTVIPVREIQFKQPNVVVIPPHDQGFVAGVIQNCSQFIVAHQKTRVPKPVGTDLAE